MYIVKTFQVKKNVALTKKKNPDVVIKKHQAPQAVF